LRATCRITIVSISSSGTFPNGCCNRHTGEQIDFVVAQEARTTLGRQSDTDIQLEAATVSRLSAYFELVDGQVRFTDVSDHGASINDGRPWPRDQVLYSGDILDVFPFVLRYELCALG
jgi:hypothetical protein